MADTPNHRLRLVIEGMATEGGHVRFEDFVLELNRFRSALNKMGRHLGGGKLGYRVVTLSHSSPAVVELEPVRQRHDPALHERAQDRVLRALQLVEDHEVVPDDIPRSVLTDLRNLGRPVGKSIRSITATSNGRSVQISSSLAPRIELSLTPAEASLGAVEGMLEAINVHGEEQAIFWIYPESRPGRVRCVISKDLEEKAIKYIKRAVRVPGELSYRPGEPFPHAVAASDLELVEREDLPGLADLRGRAPNATGSVTAVDFIEALRDGWE